MDSQVELERSLENWKNSNHTYTKDRIVSEFAFTLVSMSSRFEKNSNWLMGITAGTTALLISNTDKLAGNFYSLSDIKLMLSILVVSLSLGFVQKFLGMICEFNTTLKAELEKKLHQIMEDHARDTKELIDTALKAQITIEDDFDMTPVLEEYPNLFPQWLRPFLKSSIKKSQEDPRRLYRTTVSAYVYQAIFSSAQFITFIIFVAVSIAFLA